MRTIFFIFMLSMVLLSTATLAEVPSMINYQGTLTDAGGVALDTTVAITFSIYIDSVGGTQVWTETQSSVMVTDGVFNVLLGSVNAISDTIFNDPSRWLGVQVESNPELEPRQRILSVGYSFKAANADTAGYAINAQAMSDGDWTIDGDNIYRLDGNVGVGRTDPLTKLDIVGNTRVRGNLYIEQLDSTESLLDIYNQDVSDWELVAASDADRFDIREYGGSPSLSVEVGGNVGIGTTTPAAKLDIQGTLNVGADDTGYDVNYYGQDSGSRLFWDESNMAFRAGRDTDGSHWAPDSIGNWSLATGYNTKAQGLSATAMGASTIASGLFSTAMGAGTKASGDYSTAMGAGTEASGENTTAMGYSTIASGYSSTAMGYSAIASGYSSTAIGYDAIASGDFSTAIGENVTADANNAIVFGMGINAIDRLANNIPSSLMVGFHDTTATLFVGINHRVGVGTTTPTARLEVEGDTGYNQFRLKTTYTPTSTADASGSTGDIAWDDNYIYIKTSSGWKRAALSTF